MDANSTTSLVTNEKPTKELELERYKYILQQLHSLNEQAHKYFALFQTLGTAIAGGGVAVFYSWVEKKLLPELTVLTIRALVVLYVVAAVFGVLSIVVTIISWLDYRREETRLLSEAIGLGYRKPPSLRNCWRWGETYMVVFIVIIGIAIPVFAEVWIVPLIH